ncbi:MAG: glycosyltransferase, partial [Nitrococcus sp.]|nr:glycosyltransferase [Nitrococcus sp.]
FIPTLAGGGAERIMLRLAGELAARGYSVDLLLMRRRGVYEGQLPSSVRIIKLKRGWKTWGRCFLAIKARPADYARLALPVLLARKPIFNLRYLPALVGYLQRERPAALVSALFRANLLALWARELAGVPTRIVVSERNTISQTLATEVKWLAPRRRRLLDLIHCTYPLAERIVAVSNGVAGDLAAVTGIPRASITTIYNPVVSADLVELARAPLDHPWFASAQPPVVLAVGRLEAQKDFVTLIRAFAQLRAMQTARMIILGEGKQRPFLEREIQCLGLDEDVQLPGWVDNPYAYMARAAVFVLSSAYEGLPGALIEALACGCPVVSTDCPSGPAEILDGGRYGTLVPVGDDAGLAQAIMATLAAPPERAGLQARAQQFGAGAAVERYLEVLLGMPEPSRARNEGLHTARLSVNHTSQ